MNATQLRILFDHWLTFRPDSAASYAVARLTSNLIEAGGFPEPLLDDLYKARRALDEASKPQGVSAECAERLMDRYNKLTAEWTVS